MNHCNYCVNTPKKASYLIDGKSLVCKTCIDSTVLQQLWRGNNSTIQYIQDKQVNRYNLPLDHKYKVIGFDYCGSLLDGGGSSCENCNRLIVNIAIVENEQGKKYQVGCDCAETLSLVDCNDFWKIKEQEANHRKIVKWIRDIKTQQEVKHNVTINFEGDGAYIYFGSMWRYRMIMSTYNQYFAQLNLPGKGVTK